MLQQNKTTSNSNTPGVDDNNEERAQNTDPNNGNSSNNLAHSEFPDIAGLLPGVDKYYIGSTSGVSIVQAIHESMTVDISKDELYLTPPGGGVSSIQTKGNNNNNNVLQKKETTPPDMNTTTHSIPSLIEFYYRKCHSRYPVLDRNHFNHIVEKPEEELSYWDGFLKNVVLAIGSRYKELMEKSPTREPDLYYQRARSFLSKARFGNLQYAQACMLCALYTHRAKIHSSGPTVWHLTGMAMRSAVKIGLHRRQKVEPNEHNPYEMEFRKRLFWSIYILDRLLGHVLGRPFSIPEHDIDVQLPVDIDDDTTDMDQIRALRLAQKQGQEFSKTNRITTMTSVIYMCKLRRLESEIQAALYSVNASAYTIPNVEEVLSQQMDNWLASIPPRGDWDKFTRHDEGYDYFLLSFYRAKRLLLAPRFNSLNSFDASTFPIFHDYVRISGGVCQAYKALYEQSLLTFSPVALQTLFLSGLTLAYCTWLDKESAGPNAALDISACLEVLGVLAERWANANKYRDVFKELVDYLFDEHSGTVSKSAPDPNIFRTLPTDWCVGPMDFSLWDISSIRYSAY